MIEIIRTSKRKTCTCCGQLKFKREFYKRKDLKSFPDGYDSRCKECRRRQRREVYHRRPDGLHSVNGRCVEHIGYSLRIYWTNDMKKKFMQLYPVNTNDDLAVEFCCSVRTIVRRAREMGIEKDSEWLHAKWDENRKLIYHNPNQDFTAFFEAGKKHQFKKGVGNGLTPEQRSDIMRKAWVTRHRNQRLYK